MDKITWDDVQQSEISKELAYWKGRKINHIWLVPCRYADGEPTVSGSPYCPSSNAQKREYKINDTWTRIL